VALCLNAKQGAFICLCVRTISHVTDHTNLPRHLHLQPHIIQTKTKNRCSLRSSNVKNKSHHAAPFSVVESLVLFFSEFGLMTQSKTAKNICVWCQLNGGTSSGEGCCGLRVGLQTPSPPNRIGNICDSFRQNARAVGQQWVSAVFLHLHPFHWET